MVADECLWSFHCTKLTDLSFADKLKPKNSHMICPTIETERQIIHRPPQQRLFLFVGSLLLLMNAFTLAADFILFCLLVELALEGPVLHADEC